MRHRAICTGICLALAGTALVLRGDDPSSPVRCEVLGGIAIPPRLVIQWDPLMLPVVIHSIEIHRDREIVAQLPPESLEYSEEPLSGEHEYQVWMLYSPEDGFLHGSCTVEYEPPSVGGFRRGDANADGQHDLSDAVIILQFLFLGGRSLPCEQSADCDDSGVIEITDPIALLQFLFLGGLPPPAPFEECGHDETDDDLDCAEFPPCHHPPPP
ncbi:MAG: hypothetical protein JXA90_12060 [Planctomycetes bacterium]|nr:hypothetical protein [Planctomycetota bacterium]